ncbi:hypothetical protein NE619_14300 [Anaerovorax odorimutans]|uniref:Membrane fusion protein n=1 Tax=Anaerovorax odorimutans TaxID=109327 RepID=A0ABT1RRS7_9FIRM|nr:HlyD family efflux transporter periplasmic adaptor subunit [Anaerovorax odorimutans]MCQ4637903.1 hypothetical protein [Anaerovorax odorimutans]
MAKKNRKPIYIFVLALIILYVVIYIIPKVTGIFETTEVLKAGTLQVTEEATCYFVRGETVYEAGSAGSLDYLIDEGIHIRKGTKVVKLTEDKEKSDKSAEDKSDYKDIITRLSDNVVRTADCKAQSSGILSYYADGYENYFSPATMDELKYEKVQDLKIEAEDTKRKSTLKREPLFKICDNDNWYLVCWVEAASVAKYEAGNTVTIQLPEGDVEATVKSVAEDGELWRVIFRSNRYYKAFAKSRIEEATIVSRDYSGLIAKSSSITTKGGKPGVRVRQTSGEYTFVPIKVIASDGEYSVLQDVSFIDENGDSVNTVNVYDEILKNPGKGT